MTPSGPGATPQVGKQPLLRERQQPQQEYHDVASSWSVRKNRMAYYPEQLRESMGTRRTPTTAKPAAASDTIPAEDAILQQLLKVLDWEARLGHKNRQGSTGEHFSSWMSKALARLATEAPRGSAAAARCEAVAATLANEYSGLSVEEREAAVSEAKVSAISARAAVEEARLHAEDAAARLGSSGDDAASRTDLDAAAAAAHEEETTNLVGGTAAETDLHSHATSPVSSPPEPDAGAGAPSTPRRRVVKPETVAFRKQFAEAAAALNSGQLAPLGDLAAGEQRTQQWLSLRERRLTASAFAKALGFFSGDRVSLWEEKVGLAPPFAGNQATAWGTRSEAPALHDYQALTGRSVEACMFKVKHDDPPHGWLGASPDGLIGGLGVPEPEPRSSHATIPDVRGGKEGAGILEIKCPFNKGRPEEAAPPEHAIWYYIPQLQGLMDVFDREWCDLYVWTPRGGSASFRVHRDRAYWSACFSVLADFWWAHVVPARQARDAGRSPEDVEAFRPDEMHVTREALKAWSKRIALAAPRTYYPPTGRAD
jgi:putative phage-type endonuclease